MITAKIIKHSISKDNIEIITVQTSAPKFLDAEIEKHRMISTNSSSDRAIPVRKMVDRKMYIPKDIRINEPGMQGFSSLDDVEVEVYKTEICGIAERIRTFNLKWSDMVHKQTLNRNLLGWSMQDKVMTATREEWDYFFTLRCEENADPSIQILANAIKHAINGSTPTLLRQNMWHLPYVDDPMFMALDTAIKCSVARCARVSYLTHDKKDPKPENDIKLYDMLKDSRHWSCFEHTCTPMLVPHMPLIMSGWDKGVTHMTSKGDLYSGNHRGWVQHRKLVDGSV